LGGWSKGYDQFLKELLRNSKIQESEFLDADYSEIEDVEDLLEKTTDRLPELSNDDDIDLSGRNFIYGNKVGDSEEKNRIEGEGVLKKM
jgi:hypothetical protein